MESERRGRTAAGSWEVLWRGSVILRQRVCIVHLGLCTAHTVPCTRAAHKERVEREKAEKKKRPAPVGASAAKKLKK